MINMKREMFTFLFTILFFATHFVLGQIDTSQCESTKNCFMHPNGCTNTTCDVLITYQYNNNTNAIDVELSTKNKWIAFGLNTAKFQMADTSGEVCIQASSVTLKGFKNNGKSPDFSVATTGLTNSNLASSNGILVCRYSRPITPTGGSYMKDLNSKLYITAAYGASVSGSEPQYHGIGWYSSSPSKLDFRAPPSGGATPSTAPVTQQTVATTRISSSTFRHPSGCTSSTCNALITYIYHKATNLLEVEVSTKNKWVAFGLNIARNQMGGTSGEVCFQDSSVVLKGFKNNGKSPDFTVDITELTVSNRASKNGIVTCKYTRPIAPKAGSYMKNLDEKFFITIAYGDSVAGSEPQYHGSGFYASSSSKVDFKVISIISGEEASKGLVIAHGALMVVAWVILASSGMLIARYTRPVGGDKTCFGQKIWFQAHRSFMTMALLFTVISFIIIFVHRKGWSEGAGAHPILGIIVTVLAIVQEINSAMVRRVLMTKWTSEACRDLREDKELFTKLLEKTGLLMTVDGSGDEKGLCLLTQSFALLPIMALFRPHPTEENRWIFNWAHRIVGITAWSFAAAAIMLGLKLMSVNRLSIIIWIITYVLVLIIMDIVLYCIGKSDTAQYDSAKGTASVEASGEDKTITFRQVVFLLAMIACCAFGFATIALISNHKHNH